MKFFKIFSFLFTFSLIVNCASGQKAGGNAGVVLFNTSIYSKPGVKEGKEHAKASVNRGEAVKIKETKTLENKPGESWSKVILSDDETSGWINSAYLHRGKKWLITLTKNSPLFVRPDLQSRSIKTYPRGTQMLILKTKGDWKKVSIGYKKNGWMKTLDFVNGLRKFSIKYSVYIPGIGRCKVSASTSLKPWNEYTYTPDNAFDEKNKTSWQEGKKGNGVGEWIEIEFGKKVNVRTFMINGLVLPKKYYKMNNRVRHVKVEYWSYGRKKTKDTKLEDNNFGPQLVGLYQNVTKMRFIIESVYKGTKWRDTAVSEISFKKLR